MTARVWRGPEPAPKEPSQNNGCCGDPTDLDGGRHPWQTVGEDNRGVLYFRCPICGAETTDD